MNIHKIEKENKAFLNILSIMMLLYLFTMVVILKKRGPSNYTLGETLTMNRFTRLIIEMPPIPPKPIEKKPEITPKVEKQKKKAEPKKEIVKKKELAKPIKKEDTKTVEKKDLNEMGMLKFLGAMDDSIGGVESMDSDHILTEATTDNMGNMNTGLDTLFDEDDASQILNDLSFPDQSDQERLAKLEEQDSVSEDTTISLKKEDQKSHSFLVKSDAEHQDEARESTFIEKKVTDFLEGLKFCYDKSLGNTKNSYGKIIINFAILSSGKTEDVNIVSNDLKNNHLGSCIIDVVSRWKFPASEIEKVVVTYPLIFSTDKS